MATPLSGGVLNARKGLTGLMLAVLAAGVAVLVVLALRTEPAAPAETVEQPPVSTATPDEARPAALFFGDSYFNGSEYASRLESIGYLAGTQLGYLTMVGGSGGTGFVRARDENPATGSGNYIQQMNQGALDTIYPPRLVVIQGGVNDRGEDGVEKAVRRVLSKVKRTFPGVPVVLVGPVHIIGTEAVALAMEKAAKAHDVPFIDARDWPLDGNLGPDGVHPTVAGAQVLARYLAEDLRRVGVKRAGELR